MAAFCKPGCKHFNRKLRECSRGYKDFGGDLPCDAWEAMTPGEQATQDTARSLGLIADALGALVSIEAERNKIMASNTLILSRMAERRGSQPLPGLIKADYQALADGTIQPGSLAFASAGQMSEAVKQARAEAAARPAPKQEQIKKE